MSGKTFWSSLPGYYFFESGLGKFYTLKSLHSNLSSFEDEKGVKLLLRFGEIVEELEMDSPQILAPIFIIFLIIKLYLLRLVLNIF